MRPRRGVIKVPTDGMAPRAAAPGLEAWGARLVRTRDLALIGFAGVYAFGYLARALHAWEHNLGVLPGVELQFFVAGLVLLIPPALVALALLALWRLLGRVVRWEGDDAMRRTRNDTWTGALLTAGVLVVALAGAADAAWDGRVVPKAVTSTIAIIGIMMILIGFVTNVGLQFARPDRGEHDVAPSADTGRVGVLGWVSRALELFGAVMNAVFVANLGLLVAWLLVLGMFFGAFGLLPRLPQALGGAKPRCAQFDVPPAALSKSLVHALFAKQGAGVDAASRPLRSDAVLVYYSGSDALLFKLPADETGAGATSAGATFELKRTAIGAISWCADVRGSQTGA
jgi:hypothetical protein